MSRTLKDAFLRGYAGPDGTGGVPIDVIMGFPRIAIKLRADKQTVVRNMLEMKELQVSEDGEFVSRCTPLAGVPTLADDASPLDEDAAPLDDAAPMDITTSLEDAPQLDSITPPATPPAAKAAVMEELETKGTRTVQKRRVGKAHGKQRRKGDKKVVAAVEDGDADGESSWC